MNPEQPVQYLPEGWECFFNDQGYPYYWNKEKQISQWEFPFNGQPTIQVQTMNQSSLPQVFLFCFSNCIHDHRL